MSRSPHITRTLLRMRAVALLSLRRSSLQAFTLGSPRLWPAPVETAVAGPLFQALRPYRRRIWAYRARAVLLRYTAFALAYLVLANLFSSAFATQLAPAVHWGPALLCLVAGVFLALAQRPSLLEVAQLLDHRLRLREALGTAVELCTSGATGPLYDRQVALALAHLRRQQHSAWTAPHHGERNLCGALLAGAVATSLLAPHTGTHHAAHSAVQPASSRRIGVAQVISPGQTALAAQTGHLAPPVVSHAAGNPPVLAAHLPSLAASLQVHAGPQTAVAAANAGAPNLSTGSIGSGSGGTASHAATAPSAATATRQGGTRAGKSTAPAGGTQGAGTTGQGQSNPGNTNQGTSQAPQSAPQANPNQAGNGTGSSNGGQQSASQQANQGALGHSDQQGTGSGGNPPPGSANPFGQDPAGAGKVQSPASHPAAGAGKQNTAQQPKVSNKSTGQGTAQNAGHSQNNDAQLDPSHHARSGTGTQATSKTPARPGQAGPASGAQINIGGRSVLSKGAGGPELVRVLPLGAAPGPALGSSGLAGSTTVQGYVPEDDSSLTPEEQALVRSYFTTGNGS